MTKKEKLKKQIEFFGGVLNDEILNLIQESDLEENNGFIMVSQDDYFTYLAKNHLLVKAGLL